MTGISFAAISIKWAQNVTNVAEFWPVAQFYHIESGWTFGKSKWVESCSEWSASGETGLKESTTKCDSTHVRLSPTTDRCFRIAVQCEPNDSQVRCSTLNTFTWIKNEAAGHLNRDMSPLTFCMSTQQHTSEQEVATLRVGTAGDADGFVVDLQADGTRELALDALSRGCQRAWAAVGLLLLPELGARRDKAPKHRHHGAGDDLQLSTTARCPREEAVQLF